MHCSMRGRNDPGRPALTFDPPFECEFCGRAYSKIVYFRTHLRKKHAIPKKPSEEVRSRATSENSSVGNLDSGSDSPSIRTRTPATILAEEEFDDDLLDSRTLPSNDPFFGFIVDDSRQSSASCTLSMNMSSENVDLDNDQFFNVDDTPRFLKMVLGIEDSFGILDDEQMSTELVSDDVGSLQEMNFSREASKMETDAASGWSDREASESGSSRREAHRPDGGRTKKAPPRNSTKRNLIKKWKVVERREVGSRIRMCFRREFVEASKL